MVTVYGNAVSNVELGGNMRGYLLFHLLTAGMGVRLGDG